MLSARIANASILIVDDSEISLKTISSALQKRGFSNITISDNGEDAIAKTYQLQPHIVILDLVMPRLDGFGYCEQIRKDGRFKFMPILVQTASENRADKLRALTCGANDFLNKPLDPDELALRISIHLEHRALLCDIEETCQYLAKEIDKANHLTKPVRHIADFEETANKLHKHCETLKMIADINHHKMANAH